MKNSTPNKKTTSTENNIVYCNTAALKLYPIDTVFIEWYGKIKKYKPINDRK